jgi:hypothetical protein
MAEWEKKEGYKHTHHLLNKEIVWTELERNKKIAIYRACL